MLRSWCSLEPSVEALQLVAILLDALKVSGGGHVSDRAKAQDCHGQENEPESVRSHSATGIGRGKSRSTSLLAGGLDASHWITSSGSSARAAKARQEVVTGGCP